MSILTSAVRTIAAAVGMLSMTAAVAQTPAPTPDLTGIWTGERLYVYKMVRPDGGKIPLQPWALKFAQDTREQFRAGKPPPNNNQKCLPPGFVRQLQANFPFLIVQQEEQVTFLFEENTRVNIVHMNQPAPADVAPTWFGYSSGRWEGDTLVVETTATNGQTSPFIISMTSDTVTRENNSLEIPHTEALKVTHRFRLIDDGQRLEDKFTIEDPNAYTKPWEVVSVFRRMAPNEKLRENVCAENNLDLDLEE